MAEWQNRPLDPVYPVMFIDAINVKIRDGKVANRPIYVALAVTVDGNRDILGLWAGEHGTARAPSTGCRCSPRSRTAASATCCMRRLRRAQGPARRDRDRVAPDDHPDLRGAPAAQQLPLRRPAGLGRDRQGPQAGLHRADRGRRDGTVRRVRRDLGRAVPGDRAGCGRTPGPSSCPFLAFDVEIRKVICTTNAIESPSTPASAGPSAPAGTSRTSRPRSSASTWRS